MIRRLLRLLRGPESSDEAWLETELLAARLLDLASRDDTTAAQIAPVIQADLAEWMDARVERALGKE